MNLTRRTRTPRRARGRIFRLWTNLSSSITTMETNPLPFGSVSPEQLRLTVFANHDSPSADSAAISCGKETIVSIRKSDRFLVVRHCSSNRVLMADCLCLPFAFYDGRQVVGDARLSFLGKLVVRWGSSQICSFKEHLWSSSTLVLQNDGATYKLRQEPPSGESGALFLVEPSSPTVRPNLFVLAVFLFWKLYSFQYPSSCPPC